MNWFRKGEDGKFLWPGFGENSRVLKWVVERVHDRGEAVDTPIGRVPAAGAIDTTGLDISDAVMDELLSVDAGVVAGRAPADRGALRRHRRHAARPRSPTSSPSSTSASPTSPAALLRRLLIHVAEHQLGPRRADLVA